MLGVALALELTPVIAFAPLKAVRLPFVSVPTSGNLVWYQYRILFVASYSTTLPTAPVVAWFISSSAVNVPDTEENTAAYNCLLVSALATVVVPKFVGFLTRPILLKSLVTPISEVP